MARRPMLELVPNCGSALMCESGSGPEIGPKLLPRNGTLSGGLDLHRPLRRNLLVGVDPLPNSPLSNADSPGKRRLRNSLLAQVGFQLHRPILATLVRKVNSALLDSHGSALHGAGMNGLKRPKPGEGVPLEVKRKEGRALGALWKAHAKLTGRTQEKFSEEQGYSQGNFSHYVGGRRPIPLDVGVALAEEMRCDLEDFSPRLADELAALEDQRLAPWPFNSLHPDRVAKLSPGKKMQLEGILLEELGRIEGGSAEEKPSSKNSP